MKNIFSMFNLWSLKTNLLNIIYRFPLSIIFIIALCVLFFVNLHWDFDQNTNYNIFKSIFSILVTFFLSLWFYLTSENLWFSKIKKYLSQLLAICFWILFFFWFKGNNIESFDNVIYMLLTLFWIISFLFFSPYVKNIFKKENIQKIYYSYFYRVSVVFLISWILWWILFALGSIWITVVSELFDIRFEEIYGDWAIISLSFITPIFALTQIPKKETLNKDTFNENAFFSFLVKYIAIPFIYVYFIILYVYTVKVLINFWDWPKWEVSWMVIIFSIFGYIIYIFSYIFEDTNKFIKFFRKWFPFVVVPQLFMLFYAIYIRISQYDITVNRYFIVVFGVWLSVVSLYLIFSKRKSLAYIPLILTIFSIIISIWPWWVYSFPESRQLKRLENNLVKAWILKNWEIIPLKNYEDISPNLSYEIYSEINYLCDYNDCKSIKELFSEEYVKLKQQRESDLNNMKINWGLYRNNKLSSSEIANAITQGIKVKYSFTNDFERETLNFNLDPKDWVFPLNVDWYSKILKLGSKIDISKGSLEIIDNWQIIDIIDIKEIDNKISEKYKQTKRLDLSLEDLTFELKWTNWTYKIFLDYITLKNPLYKWEIKQEDYYYAWWYVLVK
ncbi:MAG: hypothetical protein ACD_4C00452G0002 [uncultured bacterium (gcode 4)]|uniref:DUF4153 domain-containing protein n=1 Tax=uncultured bacterium (gcode 4) TaxID=1234023 RepID=K2FW14_9BACT|nr:MAG: hypothetical protein ACD_4C00452G0002 [uncultured bacterium (gcode 4)]